MRILAFAADADLYCPTCAELRYPGCVSGDVKDREGNVVTPIFSTSSDALLQVCADCEEELDPPPFEVKAQVQQLISEGYLDSHTATELVERAGEMKQEEEDDAEQMVYYDAIGYIRSCLGAPLKVILEYVWQRTGVDTDGVKEELNMAAKSLGLGDVMDLNAEELRRVVEAHASELFGEDGKE